MPCHFKCHQQFLSDNYFNDFTENELNEVEISIATAKDASNASSDGFSPDFIPVQVLRKCFNSLSILVYNLVSFIGEAGVYPPSWNQTNSIAILGDGPKTDIKS